MRDRVDPPRGEPPPLPLDFRRRDVRLSEKRREPVESLDCDMTTTKPTTYRRERDAVLGRDGIDGGLNPENVQEPGDLAAHPMPMVGRAAVPAFIKILRVGQDPGR
jgi:hypothetical protein